MHASAFLYAAAERGTLPWEVLHELEREHLAAKCEHCKGAVEAFQKGHAAGAGGVVKPARDALESVRRRRGLTRGQLEDKVKEARRWFRFLQRKVPEGEWFTKVKGAYKWYGGPVFGTFILEEARACFPEDAGRALLLADVALASCRKDRSREPDPQVLIPALAVRGNGLRALGRLAEAEASLDEATRLLHSSELEDLLIPAELHSYLGSLRLDQLRLEEAASHVRRAAVFFSLLRSREKAARTFIKLGLVEYQHGRPDAAVEAATKAIELLGPEDESWLAGYGRYNLALFLHGRGDVDGAAEELAAHQDLIGSAGEGLVFRTGWLRGRIAWSRGKLAKADRLFREALRWARDRELHFDAGLLCLERALVHLAQGRTDRARKLVADALGLFVREEEVERETHAALELLEAAARRQEVDHHLLQRAVTALEQMRQGRRAAPARPR